MQYKHLGRSGLNVSRLALGTMNFGWVTDEATSDAAHDRPLNAAMIIGWTPEELDAIGEADELEIAPVRPGGTLRRPTPIWVVRVGNDLYVRSYRGRDGRWFRAAQATHEGHISAGGVEKDVRFAETDNEATNKAIDEQYLAKYGRYGARYVDPMVAAEARATTIKLVPARDGGGE
jgi:hypothetical protein